MKASTWVLLAGLAALCACGGGSSDGGSASSPAAPVSATAWTPGVFMPAANFAGQCTTLNENNWLRSWSNDLYLWYDEVVDRDPSLFTTPAYFDLLKTTATTPSGNPNDRFHFTMTRRLAGALPIRGVGGLRRGVGGARSVCAPPCRRGLHRAEFAGDGGCGEPGTGCGGAGGRWRRRGQ